MMSDAKVAIITGAASGMGLEVARLLAKQNRWALHLFDLNEKAGAEAATELSATFYKVDISSYESLANAFDAVFQTTKRLDFVFANAGVFEWSSFWEVHGSAGPPPEMPWSVVDVNLKGTMNTCYLAQHYFRQDGRKNGSLVLTASCTALYPSEDTPRYSATKAALLNFMQGIAPGFKSRYGVRVSAVLPGAVATNFLAGGEWPPYPPEYFTPVSLVASVVEALSAGEKPLEDAWGNKVAAGEDSGLAVEVAAGDRIYFRRPHEFCDETMRLVMGGVTRKARER